MSKYELFQWKKTNIEVTRRMMTTVLIIKQVAIATVASRPHRCLLLLVTHF